MKDMVEVKVCPWCGGAERKTIEAVSRDTNNYITAISASSGVSEPDLMGVETVECCDCETIYLANFFDDFSVGNAFATRTSAHNDGWRQFHSKSGLLPRSVSTKLKKKDVIKSELIKLVLDDGIYVEIGCPFVGLIHEMTFGSSSHPALRERYLNFLDEAISQNENAFPTFFGTMAGKAISTSLRWSSWRNSRDGDHQDMATRSDAEIEAAAKDIYLVKPESRFIWGENCTSYFASCSATLSATTGVQRIRLEEIEAAAKGRRITIGFYNTLDHLERPRVLLELCMKIADRVIVETHGHLLGGGRQHPYFLQKTFPNWAARMGWSFFDITPDLIKIREQYKNHVFVLER